MDKINSVRQMLDKGMDEKLFSWSPRLSTGAYGMLDEQNRKLVDLILIAKTGTPTLTIKKTEV